MQLRPYQLEIVFAVIDSVMNKRGLTITVEMARQGGKNEISAYLEMLLLNLFKRNGGTIVKCSPTFRPQARLSRDRLITRLNDFGYDYTTDSDYIVRLGKARVAFLSAAKTASVLGHTADILLEVDEAQDVSKLKFSRDFRPMAASSNVTTVLYGTPWDDSTLLEEAKRRNLELEARDGIKRHFSVDYHVVAQYNPDYRDFVAQELERLGPDHPWFLTQYAVQTIPGAGRLFSSDQLAKLQGTHPRQLHAEPGKIYVAGLDLAGEEENSICHSSESWNPVVTPRDSTVLVIAEVTTVTRPSTVVTHPSAPPSTFCSPANGSSPSCDHSPNCHSRSTQCISGIYPAGRNPVIHPEHSEGSGGGPAPSSLSFRAHRVSEGEESRGAEGGTGVSVPLGPSIRIVAHYSWTGTKHPALYRELTHILKDVWACRRIVVDATGVGAGVASFLKEALGSRVVPFNFTSKSKSELGYALLTAVNSGRLKLHAPDASPEYGEMLHQLEICRIHCSANHTLNFFVDPEAGHDDFVSALALTVDASASIPKPRTATMSTYL